jgi:hypothetical protein
MTKDEMLDIKFRTNDFEKDPTIREYLQHLLLALWRDKEGFSGKRPFGNSGWDCDLYAALVIAGVVKGKIDHEYNELADVDDEQADRVIARLIRHMCQK